MLAVAVRAGRRVHLAARNELAVDTGLELLLDRAVALATGRRDVEEVDRRLDVAWRQDVMRRAAGRVAIVARGRGVLAAGRRLAVHAALVHLDGVPELDVQQGQEILVLVTGAAGLGQVRRMHHRLRIQMRQDVMRAVTVLASRYVRRYADHAAPVLHVGLGHIVVAGSAVGIGQIRRVRQFPDAGVAVGAGEIFVDATGQLRGADLRRLAPGIHVAIRTDRAGIIPRRDRGRRHQQDR